ncbi:hypothetical protein LTR53_015524 [Teratosphaeriaceae sp. CCFEE 6253]|nr:hypothetical protein LTR53_015524 [Teratosphaeriaceae sp. CCFEE 6253]
MLLLLAAHLTLLVAIFTPVHVAAQSVFAHVIVGNTASYDVAQWTADIQLAASYHIDGLVLNIATPYSGATATQLSYAFQAADTLSTSHAFKLLLSFDYLGGTDGAWIDTDMIGILKTYGPKHTYFHVDGKPMVSTFEGPSNSNIQDWTYINSSVPGGVYFVPDWTSLGPSGFSTDLVDGAFSWDMWPDGPTNISTAADSAWAGWLKPAGKSYMMGVSPWFYTDLPTYNKAWVWRGDDMWWRRWQQTLDILPDFVEIVTWNDYGEAHYVRPIYHPGVPNTRGANATAYVDGYSHQAWLRTLPYQIAAYKHAFDPVNPAPEIADDKIVYWYRTAPAKAGKTQATGNNCKSDVNPFGYQTCYDVSEILEDGIFAIVLAKQDVTAKIAIGGGEPTVFTRLKTGINFISRPFSGEVGKVESANEDVAIYLSPAPVATLRSFAIVKPQHHYDKRRVAKINLNLVLSRILDLDTTQHLPIQELNTPSTRLEHPTMRVLLTLATLATSISAVPLSPYWVTNGGLYPPYPNHTTVSYYEVGGWPVDDTMCLVPAGNGTLHASVCTPVKYNGLGIWMVPHNNCTLTVYEGTETCAGNAPKEHHRIPAGKSVRCASTNAAGGGASVVWACR